VLDESTFAVHQTKSKARARDCQFTTCSKRILFQPLAPATRIATGISWPIPSQFISRSGEPDWLFEVAGLKHGGQLGAHILVTEPIFVRSFQVTTFDCEQLFMLPLKRHAETRFEAIDMGRRGLHNGRITTAVGPAILERIAMVIFNTLRRLFLRWSVVSVTWKG